MRPRHSGGAGISAQAEQLWAGSASPHFLLYPSQPFPSGNDVDVFDQARRGDIETDALSR